MIKYSYKHWYLAFGIFTLAVAIPLAIISFPEISDNFYGDMDYWMGYWIACWIYMPTTFFVLELIKQKMVSSTYIKTTPEAGADHDLNKHILLTGDLRTAQLIIMGLGMMSLNWSTPPGLNEEVILFITLRLGFTLLILGGLVVLLTRANFRKWSRA
jgi:hypothetical protein